MVDTEDCVGSTWSIMVIDWLLIGRYWGRYWLAVAPRIFDHSKPSKSGTQLCNPQMRDSNQHCETWQVLAGNIGQTLILAKYYGKWQIMFHGGYAWIWVLSLTKPWTWWWTFCWQRCPEAPETFNFIGERRRQQQQQQCLNLLPPRARSHHHHHHNGHQTQHDHHCSQHHACHGAHVFDRTNLIITAAVISNILTSMMLTFIIKSLNFITSSILATIININCFWCFVVWSLLRLQLRSLESSMSSPLLHLATAATMISRVISVIFFCFRSSIHRATMVHSGMPGNARRRATR